MRVALKASRAPATLCPSLSLSSLGAHPTLKALVQLSPSPSTRTLATPTSTAVTQNMTFQITDEWLPRNVKAAVFDIDGTLIDSNGFRAQSWKRACGAHGLECSKETYLELTGKKAKDIVAQLCKEQGVDLSEEEIQKVGAEENELFRSEYLPKAKLIQPVIDILNEAQKRGLKLAVCSGGQEKVVRQVLKDFGLEDKFEAVVSSGDVEHAKPDPAIFLKAAELLGIPASDCVAYEDAPLGIQSAQAAGMTVVDVTLIESHPEHEQRHPHDKQ